MTTQSRRTAVTAGILIGVGLGGFLDGIVLHQILQWHHMLSSWIPDGDLVGTKVNMTWDGLFHAFTWVTTLVGVVLLWRAPRVPGLTFGGSLALGWGLFNTVEGLIDHQLLGVHHVHPGPGQAAWDLAFLLGGAALVVVGWGAVRSGAPVARH
jgi:uncharacterized membrane protein